jgi:cyclic dehypoxanthinyl futalosine synthase
MMFGHVETISERMEHLVRLREVQRQKPELSTGFIAFILWPFQDESTVLIRLTGKRYKTSTEEYVRMVAISRLMLPNIGNIGASWLTVGVAAGQVSLWAGANDFGSVMMEENVVSVAGAHHSMDARGMQRAILQAGFMPLLRDQQFNYYPSGSYDIGGL